MININIDNKLYSASEGETILTVARRAGLSIPTLCHLDGISHYSSCMVCMVKDTKRNSYIPSCSALVQDGMEIDASGDDVLSLRRKALELLFSEHRAECEAPCRTVCPAGYNIPLFNRLIVEGKFNDAVDLTAGELKGSSILCVRCPAYCENGCRRKKIDIPVSIRNMKLLAAASIPGAIPAQGDPILSEPLPKTGRAGKRFQSLIGKLENHEQQEWLRECIVAPVRSRDCADFESARGEAASCMHCDCRALNDCRLRDLADEMGIKDPKGKLVNAPIRKKINIQTGLVFENAKCIKCGLCVRVCEGDAEAHLCFINRGFISIISEPLTDDFSGILQTQSEKVTEVCPTGALGRLKDQ